MFKVKFANTYDISVFKDYNLKTVQEDYYKIEKNCFCVADGVTRDDVFGNAVTYPKSKEEALKWIDSYPNPSGAYKAAKIIADNFVENMNLIEKDINEALVREAIIKANNKLVEINKNRKIDYLKEDYYACVAVGGYINNNYLYAFSIGDCHISLLDENYNLIFTTINNHKNFEDYESSLNIDWKKDEDRALVRSKYRNNPTIKVNGKDVTFGVLSGEKNAEYYIDTYKVELNNVKYICAYSDGCEMFFSSKEKTKSVLENPSILEKEGPERTLIIFQNE